jgi:hypothetical protein
MKCGHWWEERCGEKRKDEGKRERRNRFGEYGIILGN